MSWAKAQEGDGGMSTIDEILASGRYTDRRGKFWLIAGGEWFQINAHPHQILQPAQMRLLIERDLHEDECPGLYACLNHPVPKVLAYAGPEFTASKARSLVELRHDTLPAAMDAARALAVTP